MKGAFHQDGMAEHFNVLIIGAGTAGCVLAGRLSEDASRTVGLVEAGREERDPDIADPAQWPFLAGRAYDWGYRIVPQPGTNGRVHHWPRGRLLGGSSCLNAMAHVRGHPADFDGWAAMAGERWSFQSLLPAFRRSERFSAGASALRGREGPLDVYLPSDEVHPIARAFMEAGAALGAPRLSEHNAGPLAGVSPNQLTIKAGRRVTSADAYLQPAWHRPNLTILTEAAVQDLRVERDRVTGARLLQGASRRNVTADTVVVAAGAIGSPLLLLRSGIGDPRSLSVAGVACRLPLAGVGRNLHDHLLAAGLVYAARSPVTPSRLQHSESLMYLHAADLSRADGAPDAVVACVVLPVVTERFARPQVGTAYTLMCGFTHPESRGAITLTGPDVRDPPAIDPAYLATERDRRAFRESLRVAREVGQARPLDPWRGQELYPGANVRSEAEFDAFLADAAMTHHHPVGTCRMGSDPESVVDESLQVRGLANLYVVDASVIPKITTGPINAAVVAIAEHWAADFADDEHPLQAVL